MNARIKQAFAKQKQFIAFLTAGDGGLEHTLQHALLLIEGGVTLLEIGIPFSDPIADGPVIQRASSRALAHPISLPDILRLVKKIRAFSDIPIILFSYLNPILATSTDQFFQQARDAGVDGLLIVDCPIEESFSIDQHCCDHQIDLIQVITPTTGIERIQKITQRAQGFLYYACRAGTTGIKNELPEHFQNQISAIKRHTDLPVVAGFGISTHEMATTVLRHADGVVVGSLFVDAIEKQMSAQQFLQVVQMINPLTR